jgi:hypothetical protein
MDLFNNAVGIGIGLNNPSDNNNTVGNQVYQILVNGGLKYLKPLDINDNIVQDQTQLFYTNQ